MKKPLWILLFASVAIIAAFLVLRSFSQRFWERTLDGPFAGVPYSGGITTAPASVLAIPSRGQLEVHELQFQQSGRSVALRERRDSVVEAFHAREEAAGWHG